MKRVTYEDEKGRKYLVKLDDDVPDEEAHLGIPIGPPNIVDELGWPEPFATRLHNILYDRKLWSIKEVNRQRNALEGALKAALRVDITTLHNAYTQMS
jgi:hypothetical protein